MASPNVEYAHGKGSTVRRMVKRATYDKEIVNKILDENWVAHVAFVDGGLPVVIPMMYAREDGPEAESILLHGSSASRLMKLLAQGDRVCVSVASVQGLVVSLTPFHNSNNYRSVVIMGRGQLLEEPSEKMEAMRQLTNKLIPGRWESLGKLDGREPTPVEVKGTHVIRVQIEEASAKIREGGPSEDKKDLQDPSLDAVWSGVIPLKGGVDIEQVVTAREGVPIPEYVKAMI